MAHVATVTIDSAKVSANLTDFPLLIDLSDLPSSFWDVVANGGGDIRCFKSDGTTELPREVVACDTSTDTGELWIKYSGTLSGSVDTDIQIHADGTSSEPAVTATYGRNAVWSDYTAVWHLKASAPGLDSSGSGHDLSVGAGTLGSRSGPFGGTVNDYNGSTYQQTSTGPINGQFDITVQAWADRDATSDAAICSTAISGSDSQALQMRYDSSGFSEGGSNVLKAAVDSNQIETSSGSFPTGWQSFYTLRDGTSHDTYINGSVDDTDSISSSTIGAWTFFFIGNGVKDEWNGGLAEIRIRDDALSADWIETEYANQSSVNTFYSASAVGGGSTPVEIDATASQIAVTSYSGSISAGTSIAAALAGIDVTPNAGVVTLETALSGGLANIELTPNPCTVSMGTALGAPVTNIAVTVQPASVSSGTAITGSVQGIEVNALAASLSNGTSISAALAGIDLTPQAATTSLGRAITADSAQLEVTANTSSVVLGDAIAAAAQQIAVDPYSATIELGITVQGSLHQIGIEALAASVGLGSQVDAVARNIELTPHGATLTLASVISANASSIDLTAFRATVEAGVAPITVPGLEFTLPTDRMHYALPVSRIHFTFTEED